MKRLIRNKKQAMIRLNESYCYKVQEEVAIEDFADGSLLLLCDQLRMVTLNHSARRIVGLMNGQSNLLQIIRTVSAEFEMEERIVRKDIQRLSMDLGLQGAVRPLVQVVVKRRKKMGKSLELMANPDASLREEEDGAILFNADTNALLIINPIGLVIWKFLKGTPRDQGRYRRSFEGSMRFCAHGTSGSRCR